MERLGSKKVISATRSALKLDEGSIDFEGCKFGLWDIAATKDDSGKIIRDAAKIEYLAIKTTKGMRGIPLGSLYNCTLSSESKTIGELIADYDDQINPISNLKGSLVVAKKGKTVELTLNDVKLNELVE